MADLDEYPRIPVVLRDWPEWNRRGADAINRLLGDTGDVIDTLILLKRVLDERVGATAATSVNVVDGTLENWGNVKQPADSEIVFDPVTGIATIAHAGDYYVSGYAEWGGTGNNNWYGLEMNFAGSVNGDITLGSVVWAQTWPLGAQASAYGAFTVSLQPGDTIQIGWHASGSTVVPDASQIVVEMSAQEAL